MTAKLVEYLEQSGFQVTQSRSQAFISEWQIGNAPSSVWFDLARQADSREAEAVVLACSGIRTGDIIDRFEAERGKPLISAPAVVMWHALRLADINTQFHGKGYCFRHIDLKLSLWSGFAAFSLAREHVQVSVLDRASSELTPDT